MKRGIRAHSQRGSSCWLIADSMSFAMLLRYWTPLCAVGFAGGGFGAGSWYFGGVLRCVSWSSELSTPVLKLISRVTLAGAGAGALLQMPSNPPQPAMLSGRVGLMRLLMFVEMRL
ncbi:hypothetical protein Nepgr_032616 [Nepenthes gracilis]|uniref:Uncharacterized protein n=1 Tax=Nepenthes gracilis TaxID=150966 RepID=A0AAD3TKT0_NEPGR|nr:hypothetical protein Nepgr_032616 [Nepenthes gracilis]